MKPIFIFSLPRSGSTLLQRILMSHRSIASVSEPWFLLPFAYTIKKTGVFTEYSQKNFHKAFKDFVSNLPNKRSDYYEALREFSISLYKKQCRNNEIYFLDKTPRYHLIINEIAQIFPDAKFIFLFRNPVHCFSSSVTTLCQNKLIELFNYHVDLYEGPSNLSKGYDLLRDRSFAIQYENLVRIPEKLLRELLKFLDLDWDDAILSKFQEQELKGKYGDPTGVIEYTSISKKSLEKWKDVFNTPIRKMLLISYIKGIDEQIFKNQGYNKKMILDEIRMLKIRNSRIIKDSFGLLCSYLIRKFKVYIFFGKTSKWSRGKHIS